MLKAVGVVLDFPPVVVQVFEVEAVDAVHLLHRQDLADFVFVFVGQGLGMGFVNFGAGGHVHAPVVEQAAGVDLVTHLDTHHVKAHA